MQIAQPPPQNLRRWNMRKYLLAMLLVAVTYGLATVAAAQESPSKNEGKATIEGKAGDSNFDLRVQGGKTDEGQRPSAAREGERGMPGPRGPEGAPGPQGPAGPAGASEGRILGMDSNVALLMGLAILAIVIVAIVAASRGGSDRHV
jgi:hypothetical protein